jgi:glycosyltransferase involved in cell wall biosynthesis
MTLSVVADIAFACSVIPAALFCWNILLYRKPGKALRESLGPVSVLIPARNEEGSIAAAVQSVLLSRGIEFEVVVLDDSSTDSTAAIVTAIASTDSRVRAEAAPPLPAGWNGKQHACYILASLARYDTLCFLDADVRLEPEALARMATFMESSHSALVSGFPFQETESFLEWLLLPLIHFVLLAYLPMIGMRLFSAPGFAAGCGQFLMVRRDAYARSGGHAAIRATMHDGLLLPQLLRRHGYHTDIADLTELATCRMYHNAAEVWSGLAKNATEGIAAPLRIVPFSMILFFGQVAPLVLFLSLCFVPSFATARTWWLVAASLMACFLPRILAAARFRQRWWSAVLHPLGVLVLLTLQWYALSRKVAGKPARWKQRAYNAG